MALQRMGHIWVIQMGSLLEKCPFRTISNKYIRKSDIGTSKDSGGNSYLQPCLAYKYCKPYVRYTIMPHNIFNDRERPWLRQPGIRAPAQGGRTYGVRKRDKGTHLPYEEQIQAAGSHGCLLGRLEALFK